MRFLKTHLIDGLLAFASAALVWAAFPPVDCGFLAWVALTPLLVMIARASRGRAILWPLVAGYALFIMLLHWLRYTGPEGWVTLALYCALYWPAAALLLRWLRWRGWPFALTAPVTFAAFEFIRGSFLTGFPFFFLGHTQYRCLPMIQIADVTGVFGITFLIALVNGCLADLITASHDSHDSHSSHRRWSLVCGLLALALVAATAGYGWSRMRALQPKPGPKVALVQGNVPQDLKDARTLPQALEVLRRHVALTAEAKAAAGDDLALMIWPETIFPAPLNDAYDEEIIGLFAASENAEAREYATYLRECAAELRKAVREAGTYMLVGSPTDVLSPRRRYNSAYFLTPKGAIAGRYDKIHLVVFGEYTPLADIFPFLKFFRPEIMGPDLDKGQLRLLFDLPVRDTKMKFGVTICYEDAEADLFRKFVRDGAQFMVNVTNDGWFKNSSELDTHLAVCAFRAVENRVPIARCANTGISALIGPDGRIERRIVLRDGRYREVAGTLAGNLSMTELKSFYTGYGDVFGWICVAGVAGLAGVAAFRRKPPSAAEQPRDDQVKRQHQGQGRDRGEHPA